MLQVFPHEVVLLAIDVDGAAAGLPALVVVDGGGHGDDALSRRSFR